MQIRKDSFFYFRLALIQRWRDKLFYLVLCNSVVTVVCLLAREAAILREKYQAVQRGSTLTMWECC